MILSLVLVIGCTKNPNKESTSGTESESKTESNTELYGDYITLGEYKGIVIDPIEVTDDDVQEELFYALNQYATPEEITNRAVADGDTVNIDYEGIRDGVAFQGGTAQGDSLVIGSGQFIPGFEEGLIGVNPLESIELPLTFPEDYGNADLAGAEVVFRVTVNYIEGENELPAFDDEFVMELTGGELTSTTEYREWLKNQLILESVSERRSQLIAVILENSEVKGYPTELLDRQVQEIMDYYESYATRYGMTLEEFASYNGQTLDAFQEQIKEMAQESVAQTMALMTIANIENITITAEEIKQRAIDYGYSGVEEFAERFGELKVQEILLMDKVMDTLLGE